MTEISHFISLVGGVAKEEGELVCTWLYIGVGSRGARGAVAPLDFLV